MKSYNTVSEPFSCGVSKSFYSHLIEIDTLLSRLDRLELTGEQKMQLARLVDAIIHQTIMDEILSKLEEEDKKVFLIKMTAGGTREVLLEFLKGKVDNIEEEIVAVYATLKDELHADIEEAIIVKGETK